MEENSIYIIKFLIIVWLLYSLIWAIPVGIDARRRGLPFYKQVFWFLLSLTLNWFGAMFYITLTKREHNSSVSLHPLGILAGEERMKKISKYVYLFLAIFISIIWFFVLVYSIKLKKINEPVIFLPFAILYLILLFRRPNKFNALDGPRWGMEDTSSGSVDMSLEKHKKVIIGLIVLILFTVIFLVTQW